MSALYMSISANERDLEIEDDLARGISIIQTYGGTILAQCGRIADLFDQ